MKWPSLLAQSAFTPTLQMRVSGGTGTPGSLGSKIPAVNFTKLAQSGRASISTLLGGQDVNEIYFNALQMLFDTNRPFVKHFPTSTVDRVLRPLASASQRSSIDKHHPVGPVHSILGCGHG
jgi:hypothetical protein